MSNALSMNSRWTYTTEENGAVPDVPELVMLGSEELRKAAPLDDHSHPGCYEFVLMEKGKARWELEDQLFETQAGELFHTRPGELHRAGFKVIEPSKFWWLIVREPHADNWLRLSDNEIRHIEQALHSQSRVVHIGLFPVHAFRKLQLELMDNHPFRSLVVRQLIVELLVSFLKPHAAEAPVAADLLQQFDRIMARIRMEPEWRPTVQELAHEIGISASHLYRTFQQYTGFTPIGYMERTRMEEACRLLLSSSFSITEIAYRLGYPSSQYFATVFKRHTSMTPNGWRLKRLHSQ